MLRLLTAQGLLKKSLGAIVCSDEVEREAIPSLVPTEGSDAQPIAPLMVVSSEGTFMYACTDLAAIKHRIKTLKMERLLYITDSSQKDHFVRVFKVSSKL